MLFFEEEIRYLPKCHLPKSEILTYLWQHNLSRNQLLDYTHIHYPLTNWDSILNLNDKRLKERLSALILLKQLFGQQATVEHLPNGKPFVNIPKIEISISHTYNIYGVSISRLPHGMDIERWGSTAWKVREKFLTIEEEKLIDLLKTFTKEQVATLLWSAKEAVYKAFDYPSLDFKKDINLSLIDEKHTLFAYLPQYGRKARVSYRIYPNCIYTSCCPII